MKPKLQRLVILVILASAVYAVYAYFHAIMDHGKLEAAANRLFENPEYTTPAKLQEEFQRAAEKIGIMIPPEQIQFSLTNTDEKSQAGKLIQPSGLMIQSKVLTLDAEYTRRILGFPKHFSIHRRKVFTYRVEQPMTIPDEIPMD
ncbi:MAG TPA: hypothetical protein VFG95_00280 [Nitrospiria bacterium]|nr:hypothetical protein [Nitrospiria bacterium]